MDNKRIGLAWHWAGNFTQLIQFYPQPFSDLQPQTFFFHCRRTCSQGWTTDDYQHRCVSPLWGFEFKWSYCSSDTIWQGSSRSPVGVSRSTVGKPVRPEISPRHLVYSRNLKNIFRTSRNTASRFKSFVHPCSDPWLVFLQVFPSCSECLGHG